MQIQKIMCFIITAFYVCLSASAMDDPKKDKCELSTSKKTYTNFKRQDPPFFLLNTSEGQQIYILGSQHYIPLDSLFSEKVISELQKIADQKAILYTEHEVSNQEALKILKEEKSYEEGKDLLNWVDKKTDFSDYPTEFDISNCEYCRKNNEENVLLNLIAGKGLQNSETSLAEVFNKAPVWLGAVILGTHSGLISYSQFGGPEVDLINGEDWCKKWTDIRYLESLSDVLNIMKKNSKNDAPHNIDWIKKSLKKIVGFNEKDELFYKQLKKDMIEGIEAFSWDCITFSSKKAPKSAFDRNKLWVDVIQNDLKLNFKRTPIMIVVGNGHLLGIDEGFSLIGMLMNNLEVSKLYRCTNDGEWNFCGGE